MTPRTPYDPSYRFSTPPAAAVFVASLLAGAGCDDVANDEFEGESLFELRATVSSVGLTEPLVSPRAAVVWTARLDESAEEVPAMIRIAAEVDVVTPFPSEFRLDLFDEPPAEAFGDAGLAEGQLVLYDDRNRDGQLNFFNVGQEPIDRILGTNRDADGDEKYLVYMNEEGVNGAVEQVLDDICPTADPVLWDGGFNLYEAIDDADCRSGLRFDVVAPDTIIPVPVRDSAQQDLMCEFVPRLDYRFDEVEYDGTYPDLDDNPWTCDGTTLFVNTIDRPGHPCEDYAFVQIVMAAPDRLPGDWPCPSSGAGAR